MDITIPAPLFTVHSDYTDTYFGSTRLTTVRAWVEVGGIEVCGQTFTTEPGEYSGDFPSAADATDAMERVTTMFGEALERLLRPHLTETDTQGS